jgi:hypothetical protein
MTNSAMRVRRVLPAIQHDRLYAELKAKGWRRKDDVPARWLDVADGTTIVSTWTHDSLDVLVSWVDDRELSEHFYGLVYGRAVEEAVARLSADAWLITPERGIASLQHATTVEQLGVAARALGLLACGPFNQQVFDVLVGMLKSGNAALQMDALTAVMFSAWPQFEPIVAELADDENTDEDVRSEATDVLEVQHESDWNSELR